MEARSEGQEVGPAVVVRGRGAPQRRPGRRWGGWSQNGLSRSYGGVLESGDAVGKFGELKSIFCYSGLVIGRK